MGFLHAAHHYRFDTDNAACAVHNMCNLDISRGKDRGQREGSDYSLNFIEFKDDGSPYDPKQIDTTRDQLRKAGEDNNGDVTVFIYAHGWHNSAEERSQPNNPDCAEHLFTGDVAKFRTCGLEVLANNQKTDTPPGKAPRIVGIYLAWHGWDFGWPPLVWVPSYFLRMPKARSIGLSGTAEAVNAIFAEIVAQRNLYPHQPQPFFTIAMGHSFGARILEAALDGVPKNAAAQYPSAGILKKARQAQSKSLLQPDQQRIGPRDDRLPVDMVFYVNAATSHADTIQTKNEWNFICGKTPSVKGCAQNPLYYAVSSRADVLTAVVMPVANLVAMPFGYLLRGTAYSNGYHLIAAANTPWMQTHNIPKAMKSPPAWAPANGFCFQVPADDGETRADARDGKITYVVTAKPGWKHARLWDMNSDHWHDSVLGMVHKIAPGAVRKTWVISSHGDVWNTGVFNMVRAVIDTQTARGIHPDQPVGCSSQTLTGQLLHSRP